MQDDLRTLHHRVSELGTMPDPVFDPHAWLSLIKGSPDRFVSMMDSVFFTSSICDRVQLRSDSNQRGAFVCTECPDPQPCFKSEKSLILHKQGSHGRRSQMRFYAPQSGICAVCGVCLQTRLRLLKHLSDRRRDFCRSRIKDAMTPLSPSEVARLDSLDSAARKAARGLGHSSVPSTAQARTALGKRIGFCFG